MSDNIDADFVSAVAKAIVEAQKDENKITAKWVIDKVFALIIASVPVILAAVLAAYFASEPLKKEIKDTRDDLTDHKVRLYVIENAPKLIQETVDEFVENKTEKALKEHPGSSEKPIVRVTTEELSNVRREAQRKLMEKAEVDIGSGERAKAYFDRYDLSRIAEQAVPRREVSLVMPPQKELADKK